MNMIIGNHVDVPLTLTAHHLYVSYYVIFKGHVSSTGESRHAMFPERGDAFAYPYMGKPLATKITGFVVEALINFFSHYLCFSVDLVGRIALLRKAHPIIQIAAEIIQPLAQYTLGLKMASFLREKFLTSFIYPKAW